MTTLIPKYDQGSTGAINRPFNLKLQESVSVLDFGADPTGVADSTTAIQNAINWALNTNYSGGTVYIPTGTYKLTSAITVNLSGAHPYAHFTIKGDGLSTVLYQTGAGQNVLTLTYYQAPPVVQDFWLGGMIVRDMSLIGATGTQDALSIAGIIYSNFENLNCIAERYGIYMQGVLGSTFVNVNSSRYLAQANPMTGVTSIAQPQNGLRAVQLTGVVGSTFSNNVNTIIGMAIDGCFSDGAVLSNMHRNTMEITVENNAGNGVYFYQDNNWNSIRIYGELNVGGYDFLLNQGQLNTISILCADNGNVQVNTAYSNRFYDSQIGSMTNNSSATGTIFDNVQYAGTWTDSGTGSYYVNLRQGIPGTLGTLEKNANYITGSGAPGPTSAFIGQEYLDTVGLKWYKSVSLSAWTQISN